MQKNKNKDLFMSTSYSSLLKYKKFAYKKESCVVAWSQGFVGVFKRTRFL